MFVKAFFSSFWESGKIVVLLSADTTGMGRSRRRAGSYEVTRSAGWRGSRAAGRSIGGQHGVRQPNSGLSRPGKLRCQALVRSWW